LSLLSTIKHLPPNEILPLSGRFGVSHWEAKIAQDPEKNKPLFQSHGAGLGERGSGENQTNIEDYVERVRILVKLPRRGSVPSLRFLSLSLKNIL
jgi:hypothetical protein